MNLHTVKAKGWAKYEGQVGSHWVGSITEEDIAETVAYLEEEISFRFTPLPRLFEHLSGRRGRAGTFFGAVFAAMEDEKHPTMRESWSKAVERELPLLREEERQTLEELGEVLGQYDAETQGKALHVAGERLAAAYLAAREDRQRLGKVYLALGVAGGAVTVLALI